jgi:hypothetical protein
MSLGLTGALERQYLSPAAVEIAYASGNPSLAAPCGASSFLKQNPVGVVFSLLLGASFEEIAEVKVQPLHSTNNRKSRTTRYRDVGYR